ncbi:FIST signal transduction protein [Cellulophaga baltica]|uniref:Histidine kinase n=1 Tax=Cellulophaga baltica 18 TaxID=1348584 RepID=A0AAU8RTV0_9FLAO|nr:FIST N-terminal domain-containing protein [Cellulophaga baltica]AIZ42242.1 histidine kinase [Cellulophaga baltica 18]WFO17355.1 FIST C-terminal domain-containing protein [Cellulophaga baltica 4]
MKIIQAIKHKDQAWKFMSEKTTFNNPLVLVFGNRFLLESPTLYEEIKTMFPDGNIVFGSTSGEILGENVFDDSMVITAIDFENSTYVIHSENIINFNSDSEQLGAKLASKFTKEGLKHLFIVSEGSLINGSALIKGLEQHMQTTTITGGLCGDGALFEKTLASHNENPKKGEVIAIGLYGEQLEITCANYGGWSAFGPERIISKSKDNVLYELDGQPALDLYKKYLGDKANELPQAALLYPLSLRVKDSTEVVVRTIINIDEKANTMILAGDVPEGSTVQLMMSTVDDIAEGAAKAGMYAMRSRTKKPDLALLVSCIGRRLVMNQRTEEEIEEVIEAIGKQAAVAGFYSYGELSPFSNQLGCKLHNQTMTLTLISE